MVNNTTICLYWLLLVQNLIFLLKILIKFFGWNDNLKHETMVAEVEFFNLKILYTLYYIWFLLYLAKKFEKTESFDILNLVFENSNLKLLNSLKLGAWK